MLFSLAVAVVNYQLTFFTTSTSSNVIISGTAGGPALPSRIPGSSTRGADSFSSPFGTQSPFFGGAYTGSSVGTGDISALTPGPLSAMRDGGVRGRGVSFAADVATPNTGFGVLSGSASGGVRRVQTPYGRGSRGAVGFGAGVGFHDDADGESDAMSVGAGSGQAPGFNRISTPYSRMTEREPMSTGSTGTYTSTGAGAGTVVSGGGSVSGLSPLGRDTQLVLASGVSGNGNRGYFGAGMSSLIPTQPLNHAAYEDLDAAWLCWVLVSGFPTALYGSGTSAGVPGMGPYGIAGFSVTGTGGQTGAPGAQVNGVEMQVLSRLQQFGEIVDHALGGGNWMFVK